VSTFQTAAAPQIFRARDVERLGLTRGRLRGMLARGEAERVARGLYRRELEPTELDTVALVSARVPGAVVCLMSALAIHGIGTQLPDEVWIAIDRKARKPRIPDLPIRVVRFARPLLRDGVEERNVEGVTVRITSVARTIVDCFRYRNKIGLAVALEALRDSLRRRRVSVDAILRAAEVCRMSRIVRTYLEASL
jgi:predicted transcriptional regulator of viral defense system